MSISFEETARSLVYCSKSEREQIIIKNVCGELSRAYVLDLMNFLDIYEENKNDINFRNSEDFYVFNHSNGLETFHLPYIVESYLEKIYLKNENRKIQVENFINSFGDNFNGVFLDYFFDVDNIYLFEIIAIRVKNSENYAKNFFRINPDKIFENLDYAKIIIDEIPMSFDNIFSVEKLSPDLLRSYFEKLRKSDITNLSFSMIFLNVDLFSSEKHNKIKLICELMYQIKLTRKLMSNLDISIKEMKMNFKFLELCQTILTRIFNTFENNFQNKIKIILGFPKDTFVEIIDEKRYVTYGCFFTNKVEEINTIGFMLSQMNNLEIENNIDISNHPFERQKILDKIFWRSVNRHEEKMKKFIADIGNDISDEMKDQIRDFREKSYKIEDDYENNTSVRSAYSELN